MAEPGAGRRESMCRYELRDVSEMCSHDGNMEESVTERDFQGHIDFMQYCPRKPRKPLLPVQNGHPGKVKLPKCKTRRSFGNSGRKS